ncbi:MAG: DNA mismatch repair protein MutS, partial [Lachnospiraceae bacterium]|nr:DNA mismatch repair protein MutS [Lachnospiraceae bacterium]
LIGTLDNSHFEEKECLKALCGHFKTKDAEGLGLKGLSCGICAAGALIMYLTDTQKTDLRHISRIRQYKAGNYMVLGASTMRNLELTETLREKERRGTLLWVLDRTKTAMGARMLRKWIEQPLILKSEIERRLDAVEALMGDAVSLEELREYLNPVYDLERLAGRISLKSANPRDLVSIRTSMSMLPHIRDLLAAFPCRMMKDFAAGFDDLHDLRELLEDAVTDDPPLAMKEGGIIRDGYSADVDMYRKAKTDGKTWLAELEAREKERTGIHTLKIKFNRVFGYCIEVSNSFKDRVPAEYTRRQTLVGGERYTMQELSELENKILGAQDRLYSLEYDLYCEVRDRIGENLVRVQKTAETLAAIDALSSLAHVASSNGYVRPAITDDGSIKIKDGRHPVVEKMAKDGSFVPNDTDLDTKKKRIMVITGPNMAGKSTYMRQTALIVLMAQMGSFVPAASAQIGIVDRIFTRVGASDNLASGQSTFMVEMTEVASILRSATSKSLLILDEIGRGTSTFDGLALAWAIVEYVADRKLIGARTLFATHYHELTELEGKIDGVRNYCIAVKEKGDTIVFLRRIIKGGADRSYGIQVARLAGVPEAVLARADQLAAELAKADITEAIEQISGQGVRRKKSAAKYDEVDMEQISFLDAVSDNDVLDELRNIEIQTLTPLDALNELYRLQNKLKNRWKV